MYTAQLGSFLIPFLLPLPPSLLHHPSPILILVDIVSLSSCSQHLFAFAEVIRSCTCKSLFYLVPFSSSLPLSWAHGLLPYFTRLLLGLLPPGFIVFFVYTTSSNESYCTVLCLVCVSHLFHLACFPGASISLQMCHYPSLEQYSIMFKYHTFYLIVCSRAYELFLGFSCYKMALI